MCAEDKVRDKARELLNFYDDNSAISGVGQQTTFNTLDQNYWKGNPNKPDGWYLPKDTAHPAIVLECANSKTDLIKKDEQIKKYIEIAKQKYKNVVGISYNGFDVAVYKDEKLYSLTTELFDKNYYLNLFNNISIDKVAIYNFTKSINDNLHGNFGINNLKHRMIFTACALVADKNGADLKSLKNRDFETLRNEIIKTKEKSYSAEIARNIKLNIIKEQFNIINFNYTENQKAINDFIDDVAEISRFIKSSEWSGEDVMGIFFNEFTRYKGKSEVGQVFTPDHITSLIYRITATSYKDKVLDATCGSGAFLVKAMNNMINEIGGENVKDKLAQIQNEKLFGVEFDKELFALSCANMIIHKDGKTNITHGDARSNEICEWIKQKEITRVLMNPPYEEKFGCCLIVENVLNNVSDGAICAFILPSNKLVVKKNLATKWLKKHSLLKIIKLPPELFRANKGHSDTSIFIFKAHEPQNNKPIFACYIEKDGLETIKNQGRQDSKGIWKQTLEDYWVDVIYKQSGDDSCQWISPNDNLCYAEPQPEFEISEKDFKKVVLDYMLFENGIDKKDFENTMLESLLYDSDIKQDNENFTFTFKAKKDDK